MKLAAVTVASALVASNASSGKDTPITRVVNLLKGMSATLTKDMEEDEGLYDKLKCWCNNNSYEKANSIDASTQKMAELESTIESLTARSSELSTQIKDLNAQVADDKTALADATGVRKQQQKEFQGTEDDSIQAVENCKAAITVLGKHAGSAFPQMSLLGLASKDTPFWSEAHEDSKSARAFDDVMGSSDVFDHLGDDLVSKRSTGALRQHKAGFMQGKAAQKVAGFSDEEAAVVRNAFRSSKAFLQAHHGEGYMPSYDSKSGEILGVLKTMQEEMMSELSSAQKTEQQRAASFAELRTAKTSEIEIGEKRSEQKEDELATTNNDLAEAKEDVKQEQVALQEAEKFSKNLEKTCADADAAFEVRKIARMEEIKAVSETIDILMADDARDTMSKTYSFMQIFGRAQVLKSRSRAAAALRRIAVKAHDPRLSMLATAVELDAFGKVKQAIDDMVSVLKVEQADEVKKNDWCNSELQDTEMTNAKTEDYKGDLEAKDAELESTIKSLEKGVVEAQNQISELQVNLQRASEDRKQENREFQTSVSDQAITVEVLKKALDKMAKFYDESLLQVKSGQTPPVPQAEYKPSSGAGGVMSMIEKLIEEAHAMTADSKKSESEAQAAYEQTVADTNDSVGALQKEVVSKSKAKAQAAKDKQQTADDIMATVKELEGLSKATADLHGECDYVMKNFEVRQTARGEEIEALASAKQILSGASA